MKFCECGCNQPAPIATRTNKKRGWIKGVPLRFIKGHSGRIRPKGINRYKIDNKTGCWIWQGALTNTGYGRLSMNSKQILAHRFFYELHKGKIPEGMDLHHKCNNPPCVNPSHLEPVTHAFNCRSGKRAKCKLELVNQMKKEYQNGISIRKLAEKFKLDWHTVRSIVRGESWN